MAEVTPAPKKEFRMLPNTGVHELTDGQIVVSGPAGCIVESEHDLAAKFPGKFVPVIDDTTEVPRVVEGEKKQEVDPYDATAQFNVEGLEGVKVIKSGAKKFKISVKGVVGEEMTKAAVASTLDDMRSAE